MESSFLILVAVVASLCARTVKQSRKSADQENFLKRIAAFACLLETSIAAAEEVPTTSTSSFRPCSMSTEK